MPSIQQWSLKTGELFGLEVPRQPELYKETMFQNKQKTKQKQN